jgi:hypothetical protein
MGLKIKWNDDRVRGAITAVLLVGRARLARGETEDVVPAALAEYRADPAGYKENKRDWPEVRALGPLTKPAHVAYYQNLLAATDRLSAKLAQSKIQFNSLLELDNYLAASLGRVSSERGSPVK